MQNEPRAHAQAASHVDQRLMAQEEPEKNNEKNHRHIGVWLVSS